MLEIRTRLAFSCLWVVLLGCARADRTPAADSATPNAAPTGEAAERSFRQYLDREWELVRLGDQSLPPNVARDPAIPPGDPHPGIRPTLRFATDASGAGGRSFCNAYGGPYTFRGDSLQIRDIMSTAVGCDGPDSLETRFFRGLRETRRFRLRLDTLILIAGDSSQLVFAPRAP